MAGNATELIFSEAAFNKLMGVLDKVETKLKDVQKTTKALKANSTSITFKFNGIESLDKFLENMSRGKVNQFLDLIKGFERLIGVGAKTGNFAAFIKDLNGFTAKNMQPLISGLQALADGVDEDTAKHLTNVAKALNQFDKVGVKGDPVKATTFIKEIGTALSTLSKLSVEDIETAAKNIARFGSGMEKMVGTIAKVDNSLSKKNTTLRLGTFFAELSTALRLVVSLQQYLGEGKAVRELSLTIERLGLGVAGLTKNLDQINTKSTTKLVLFLTSMAAAIRIINVLSGDAKKTQALASLFTGLANLIKTVFVGFDAKGLTQNAKVFVQLQARVKLISNIVSSLKNMNFKDSAGVATVIQSVSTLFEAMSKITSETGSGISDKTVERFKDFISALKDLNKLKISDGVGKALEGVGKIFENLEKSDQIKGGATKLGTDMSNSVALGFIKGTLAVAVGKFVLRLFSDLNPAVLTAKFVTGMVTAFVGMDTKIRQVLQNVVTKVNEVGTNLTTFGQNLNQMFGVGGLLNSAGFNIAAQFENLANKSQVVGNLSDEQLGQVLKLADTVGQIYPVSANEALQAIINLQKAGINALPDLEAVIRPISDLAALSDSGSIDGASRTIIQVISSFAELRDGVDATFQNAAIAADILSRAADGSTASVESLSDGLANVGPTASNFGLSLEETAAVLALFEDRGIRGAEAGTQLRSMLNNMVRPTETVRNELNKLGISLTNSDGSFRDLNDIMNDFNHAFNDTKTITRSVTNITEENRAGLDIAAKAYANAQRQVFLYQNGLKAGDITQEEANEKIAEYGLVANNASAVIQRLTGDQATAAKITEEITRSQSQNFESLNQIFGKYGQQGAAILIALGDDSINEFIAQMDKLPTAAERAQQMMASFTGQVEQLRGSGETLIKNFFLPMIETVFYPFVQGMIQIVNAVINLNPEILALVSTATLFGSILATVVAAVATAAGFFITFGGAILGVATSFLSFSGVVAFVTTFAASITGLVVGLAGFVALAAPIAAILLGLSAGFRVLVKIFQDDINGAASSVRVFAGRIGEAIRQIQIIATAIGDVIGVIFGQGSSEGFAAAGEAISDFFGGLTVRVNMVVNTLTKLGTAFTVFTGFLKNDLQAADVQEYFGKLGDLAEKNPFIQFLLDRSGLERSAMGVGKLFVTLREGLNSAAKAFATIGSGMGDLFNSLNDPAAFEAGKTKIIAGLSDLASTATKAFALIFGVNLSEAIAQFDAGDLSLGLSTLLTKAFDGLKTTVLGNREAIKGVLTEVFAFFFIPGGFLAIITDFLGLGDVSNFIRGIQSTLKQLFGGVVDTFFNLLAGQDLKTALINSFGAGIKPIIKFVETLGNLIGNAIGFIGDLLASLFPMANADNATGNILDAVTGVFEFLTNALTFLSDSVITPLRNLLTGFDLSGVADFIGGVFNTFVDFFNTLFSGDFSGALTKLEGIGTKIFETISDFVASAFNIDLSTVGQTVTDIANGIYTFIKGGVEQVAGLFGAEDFNDLASKVVNGIRDAVTDFFTNDPTAKFAQIGTDIVTAIGNGVLDAFTRIGEILGFDPEKVKADLIAGFQSVIDGVNQFFTGEDSIFTSIETIFNKIKTAIEGVLNIFTGGGAGGAAVATGEQIVTVTSAFQGIYDFLGKLAGLALEGVGGALTGISNFFASIASLDGNQLLLVSAGIGLVSGAIVFLANSAAIIAAVSGGLVTLAAGLGIFVGAVALLNITENLGMLADIFKDLLDLDIAGAAGKIVEFFATVGAGVVFDILGLFGIDEVNGITAGSVKEKIRQVADFVSEKFTELGETLIKIKEGIQPVLDFLGVALPIALRILGFTLSLFLIPFQVVYGLIKSFIELPADQQKQVVLFLIAVGAAFALMNLPAIALALGAVVAKLLVFVGTIASTVLAAGAILIIGVAIKSAVDNISKLFTAIFNVFALVTSIASLDLNGIMVALGGIIGGIVDFIGSTVIDAVFTIGSFFGFTTLFGATAEDFKTTLRQFVAVIKLEFILLGLQIKTFFTETFADINNKLAIAAADLRLVVSDAAARARTIGGGAENDSFFKAQNIFDPATFNLDTLYAAIGDSTIDQTALRDFAIKNAALIKDSLIAELSAGNEGYTIGTAFQFVAESNNFNDVIKTIFSLEGDAGVQAQQSFINGLNNAFANDQIGQADADEILNNIYNQIGNGTLSPEAAAKILSSLNFTGTELNDDQRDALLKTIQGFISDVSEAAKIEAEANPVELDPAKLVKIKATGGDGTVGFGDGASGVTPFAAGVKVTLNPTVVPPEDGGTKLNEDIQAAVDVVTGNSTVNVAPELPVTPVFTGVTNQEDVIKFQSDVNTLKLGLEDANTKFDTFATKANENTGILQTLSLQTATSSALMVIEFEKVKAVFSNFTDTVVRGVNDITAAFTRVILAIIGLAVGLALAVPTITINVDILKTVFNQLGESASLAFIAALDSVAVLDGAVKNLIVNLDNAIAKAASMGGVGVEGGRAEGGPVWKGLFEVGEKQEPELLFQNGRMYLISPTNGFVEPISNAGGKGAGQFGTNQPVPQAAPSSNVINTSNFTVTEGDIVVQVTGGAVSDTQIVQIRDAVRTELSNRNDSIQDRLRTAGRG